MSHTQAELKKMTVAELAKLISKDDLIKAILGKSGEKPGRKPKKAKDPNAPKRAQTAFFLWLNDNRAAIKKANPNAAVTEIAKLAGEQWKKVSAADKKKYDDLNAKDKERYEKETAAYTKK